MKLATEVHCEKNRFSLSLSDDVCVIGSCFADAVGERLATAGFRVLRNPFGTLYNPASIAAAVARLDSAEPFTAEDCVEMGAGVGRVCSFSHHTRFARPTAEEFLQEANAHLAADAAAWRRCGKVIVTLGTARVWRALERPGQPVVANCLKRPAREFAHELLDVDACAACLQEIVDAHPDKEFLFTVSPIRHMGDGAHANTVSKATLHLALEKLTACGRTAYFPAYEIMQDELRDYRFYAEDLLHPSPTAVQIIWDRFVEACVPETEQGQIRRNEKTSRASLHRPLLAP